jgi:HD-GYP domain-containing protein (c-di-GMP phosphodiesterase class II)
MRVFDKSNFYKKINDFSSSLLSSGNVSDLIDDLLIAAKKFANAEGATLYLIRDKQLEFSTVHSDSLKINHNASEEDGVSFPPIDLYNSETGDANQKNIASFCAINKEIINVADVYRESGFDFSAVKEMDKKFDYHTVSMLAMPVIGKNNEVLAVFQLINAMDDKGHYIAFERDIQESLKLFVVQVGIALQEKKMNEYNHSLMESFIEVIARAIDAKSPYTGAHCQRVPVITRLLATAAVEEKKGSLADFEMSSDDWYSLHIASWLHDCGKVTTPEYIVDKATKLETVNNRIHEIRTRFEILRRDVHIEYLKYRLANVDTKEKLQENFVRKVKSLESDFEFVANCNVGDNYLLDDDIQRLNEISNRKYTRYFDKTKGLSWAERDLIKGREEEYSNSEEEKVLQDNVEHVFGGYNRGELYNLRVKGGTINKEERDKINEHIKVTIDMLKALPFPKELSQVVEFAGGHHERVDGKGYPNGLTGDEMSIPTKIMAIADIFEALTATDRPYKEPKKLSKVLSIMKDMKENGHIDSDLYRIFIEKKVYEDYAKQYIEAEQIDDINKDDYL